MRYISEEFLIELRDNNKDSQDSKLIEWIIDECTEPDELTVSELRQMSEAPRDKYILVLYSRECDFEKVIYDRQYGKFRIDENSFYRSDSLLGWIPLPQYKPEE